MGEIAGTQRRISVVRKAVLPLFLTSGAAGLIYEVTWTRAFGAVFGNTIFAVSTVLTAFMLGLALGSWLLGRVADRSSRPLLLYALLELMIGGYAFGLPVIVAGTNLFYRWFFRAFEPGFYPLSLVRFFLSVLILIIPTALMGGTLPVLSKLWADSPADKPGKSLIGRNVGSLYAINTFGAVAGSFLAGYFLIELFGVRNTIFVAASANVAVGLIALILHAFATRRKADGISAVRRRPSKKRKVRVPKIAKAVPDEKDRRRLVVLIAVAMAGFAIVPLLGLRDSFLAVIAMQFLLAVGILLFLEWRRVTAGVSAAAVAGTLIVGSTLSMGRDVVLRTINTCHRPSEVIYIRDDATGTVTVHDLPDGDGPLNTDDRPSLEFGASIKRDNEQCWIDILAAMSRNHSRVSVNTGSTDHDRRQVAAAMDRYFNGTHHALFGLLAMLEGNPAIMNRRFEAAQKANPEDRDVQSCLDEMKAEITALAEAVQRTPAEASLRSRLAKRYLLLRDYERAAEHYESFVELEPKNAAGWNNMGICYNRSERFDKAIWAFEKALVYDKLARSYFMQNKHDLALEMLEKAIGFASNDPQLRSDLQSRRDSVACAAAGMQKP